MLPLRDENPHPPGFKPTVTIALIIINVTVFILEILMTGQFWEFNNRAAGIMFTEWGTVPACISGSASVISSCPPTPYISLLSSTFMHGGLMHLGGNMLFLWIFGDNIELKFGKIGFIAIYLVWGILAGLAHVAINPVSGIPAIGASGAISGILGAYLVLFPRARIMTFMMLGFFWRMMHIRAKWFLPFWLVFQNLLPFFLSGFGVAGGGVAFMAHIGGFAVGALSGLIYKKTHRSEFMYGQRYGYDNEQ